LNCLYVKLNIKGMGIIS